MVAFIANGLDDVELLDAPKVLLPPKMLAVFCAFDPVFIANGFDVMLFAFGLLTSFSVLLYIFVTISTTSLYGFISAVILLLASVAF